MSRTIRNRHMRGHFWWPNLESEMAMDRGRGFSEERVEIYSNYTKKYLQKFHRDGYLGNRGSSWWFYCKEDQVRTLRREMSKYLHNQEWEEEVIPQKRNLSWYYT